MKHYNVVYTNAYGTFHFPCWADNEEHAKEQCLNAEPGVVIVRVELR